VTSGASSGRRYMNLRSEGEILIEQWRVHYNTVRPHSSLNWKPPAP